MIHFHTNRHDAGYLSNDEPNYFASFEDAWQSVKFEAESHIDYYSQGELDVPIRGQISRSDSLEMVTAADEIDEVERQVAEFERHLVDPDYRARVERDGLVLVLEDGIAVIELAPCQLTDCEEINEDS